MAIIQDDHLAAQVGTVYGQYRGSLDTRDCRVDVFEFAGELVAYVASKGRRTAAAAVAGHLGELERFARRQQPAGKLRLVYT